MYPEVKECWEDAGNSTCEANQAILEDTILDSNTYEMADQDEEIITQDECFSTIRMDWCSQHNIARQLCYVMPEPCNANTEDKEMIQNENEGGNNDEEKDKKWVTKMDEHDVQSEQVQGPDVLTTAVENNGEPSFKSEDNNGESRQRCSQCFKSHFPHKRFCNSHPKFCKAPVSSKKNRKKLLAVVF